MSIRRTRMYPLCIQHMHDRLRAHARTLAIVDTRNLLLVSCMNGSHHVVDHSKPDAGVIVQSFKDHSKYVVRPPSLQGMLGLSNVVRL